MVMFLFALAEVIEAKSLDRARNAIRGLMESGAGNGDRSPGDGSWLQVAGQGVPRGCGGRACGPVSGSLSTAS